MLARALRGLGDDEGAIASFRKSLNLDLNDEVAKQFAWTVAPSRSLEEARVAWEKFLERDPSDHEAWRGFAPLCLFLGHEDAYRKARRAILRRFGRADNGWLVAERAGVECLLLPDSSDDLRRAIRLAELAFAGEKRGEPVNPYLQFVKGLALYRNGRPEEAIDFLRTAAEMLRDRAGPGLVLAMAQFRSGKTAEARKTLAAVVRAYNWKAARLPVHADQSTLWVSHVLRREAEAMILPNLSAFLQGDYQPQDNDERIALLGFCQAQNLTAAAARLFASAFADDPELADRLMNDRLQGALDDLKSNDDPIPSFSAACRYLAACCAASAGCGLGKDAETLSEPERTRWRKQAREWLQADLKVWLAKLNSQSRIEQSLAKRVLTNWQIDPDLAGLREPDALDRLSEHEQNDCLAFWREVRNALRHGTNDFQTVALELKRSNAVEPSPPVLMRLGRLETAKITWKKLLEADPPDHGAWDGYAELCLFLGDGDEYHRTRRVLLERFGDTADPYVAERLGRAALISPSTPDELRQAVSVAERAVARTSGEQAANSYFAFARGLAQYRRGQFDLAIAAMRGDARVVLGPAPAIVLAMALHRKGDLDRARKTLASAVLSYDWRANQVLDQHACIAHVLRREAEAMILPNLHQFLDDRYRPEHNDERLAFLGICQFTDRTSASAKIYVEAFAAEPRLAEDLRAGHRYKAARAAALAGCGIGQDASKLGQIERSSWRRQALVWLRADLTECTKWLSAGLGSARELVRNLLASWKTEPDLAGLRDRGALAKLSTNEQNSCVALWHSVDELLTRAQANE
jgi:tetratricopeptide (TPR) repeat protein